jgi:hypothetical protein
MEVTIPKLMSLRPFPGVSFIDPIFTELSLVNREWRRVQVYLYGWAAASAGVCGVSVRDSETIIEKSGTGLLSFK